MTELKKGDRVKVDGETVTIRGSWGQGVHKMFRLEDNRIFTDLDKAVSEGKAELLSGKAKKKEFNSEKNIPKLDREARKYGEELED